MPKGGRLYTGLTVLSFCQFKIFASFYKFLFNMKTFLDNFKGHSKVFFYPISKIIFDEFSMYFFLIMFQLEVHLSRSLKKSLKEHESIL